MNEKTDPLSAVAVDPLVMRLRRYNEWRRGADFEQPEPAEIGRDIDEAIAAIEQLDELRTAVIASLILLPTNNDGKRLLESAIGIGA